MLDQIKIASPCDADWNGMQGDDRVRFCAHCQKNVYNLSALTRRDAEALIKKKEGNLCARFYRRADGTVLTQDCPVGLRAKITRRMTWVAASAMTLATAWAQDPAMLTGKVMDATGASIPDAVVSVKQNGTPIVAKTDGLGRFRMNPPTTGDYDVTVNHAGFRSYRSHVVLQGEKETRLDVTLEIAAVSGVLVTAVEPAAPVDPENPFTLLPSTNRLLPSSVLPSAEPPSPPQPKRKPWWRRIL